MTSPKNAHILSSYFGQRYKVKYGKDPRTNRNKARWSWAEMLMDMTLTEVKELVDFYFETLSANGHSLEWFFYNYDKLAEAKEKTDADRKHLAAMREATRLRTEEWRKKTSGE